MKPFRPYLKCTILWVTILFIISCDIYRISVEPSTKEIAQYKTLFVKIDLNRTYKNPYNPQEIKVDAVINSPTGQTFLLPCFYKDNSPEKSFWQARFTPVEIGTYSYQIQTTDTSGTSQSDIFKLNVEPSDANGFLHLNTDSYYSLRYSSGKRFRGVGLNVCWDTDAAYNYTYLDYLNELEKNNANFIRVWMCPWNMPLEWTKVNNYQSFTDELENWDKVFYHSPGIKLVSGKTNYTEDDSGRVTFPADSTEIIIYKLNNIKRFKLKTFYKDSLSKDRIHCYGSFDNVNYKPIPIEFSQTWDTQENWYRIFIAYITDLPDSINFLKIEFKDHVNGSPNLANVFIEYGEPQNTLDAPGLGRYYEKSAAKFDKLLKMAEEKGIYIMLTHDYHGIFKSYMDSWASNAEWRTNPYNAAMGGPCKTPADFFTNAEANQYYKNKLLYMVARWGYSSHLGVWEFWNEIDNAMDWQNIPPEAIASWHDEMSTYLKEIDPYDHLVSTSVSYRSVPGMWEVKNLDFTQHHNYGSTDNMYNNIIKYESAFHKPDVIGEYAISWKPPGQDVPVELYESELHNGLWRGMFSPTPILPMSWWWEWHYQKHEYFHFKMAEAFLSLMLSDDDDIIEEFSVQSSTTKLEIRSLKSGDGIFIWMLNKSKSSINTAILTLDGIIDGDYQLKIYNPWTGEYSKNMDIQISKEKLNLRNLRFKGDTDLALYLMPKK